MARVLLPAPPVLTLTTKSSRGMTNDASGFAVTAAAGQSLKIDPNISPWTLTHAQNCATRHGSAANLPSLCALWRLGSAVGSVRLEPTQWVKY